jgi:hypothetical protein
MITSPTIELRKFNYAAFASQETQCFSAEVWVNGHPAFNARNEGAGGADHYTPLTYDAAGKGAMDEAMAILRVHCATLPPKECHGVSLVYDVELLIADFVEATLIEKDVESLMRKTSNRLFFIRDGKLYQSSKVTNPKLMAPAALQAHAACHPSANIVNLLPEPALRAIFTNHVRNLPLL